MSEIDTIAFLNNYATELRKTHLDEKGKEMLKIVEDILRKQVELEETLSLLKGKGKLIETDRVRLFSHVMRHENELPIEELSKNS